MPKTIASMKTRLEHALLEADEADDVVDLMKEAIARFRIRPTDLFTDEELEGGGAVEEAPYVDRNGNTWSAGGVDRCGSLRRWPRAPRWRTSETHASQANPGCCGNAGN